MANDKKSLYDAGYGEIFFKNFLVGFARGLGGLFTYLILLAIVYYSFVTTVLPKLQPLINTFQSTQETLQKIQKPATMLNTIFDNNSSGDLDTPSQTR
jgi:hypothetical protein